MSTFSKMARCGAAIAILSLTSSGWAQYGGGYGGQTQRPREPQMQQPQQQQRQQARKMKMQGEGTVAAVAPGVVTLVVDGNPWVIHLERNARVQVTGTADTSALKPGQFVRFRGAFDDKGLATAPVDALEIITPLSPAHIGVFPEGAAAASGGKPAKRGQTIAGNYLIVGKITSIKDNELVIAATNKPITVQIAEGATVKLDVNDYSLAKPGDKAAVQGWYTQPGTGYANQVSIALSNPVTAGGTAATKAVQPGPALQPAGGTK